VHPTPENAQTAELRARLALRIFTCSYLARQLETANFIQKPAITLRLEETMKECQMLQILLDVAEKRQRELRAGGSIDGADEANRAESAL
jgi:hypothetical protein